MSKGIFKSIWAVFAGFAAVAVLSIATDFVLEAMGIFPPQNQPEAYTDMMLFFALVYRGAYTVLGGYITASLAPSKPMKHVIILIVIGTITGTLGAIAGWNLSAHWYPISLVITAIPCLWLGGKLGMKRTKK